MRLDLDNLPSDPALLHRLVRDMAAVVTHRDGEIDRLQTIIKQLQRAQFGRRSERLNPEQLALGLEDIEADIAGITASRPVAPDAGVARPSVRNCQIICRAMRSRSPRRVLSVRAAAVRCTAWARA